MKTPLLPTPALRKFMFSYIGQINTGEKTVPAMNSDWSFLSKLLFGFMNLGYEINEPFS